ncbi:MAG TPA: peptidyl-alpha-hydroxyglycine alpha-amidating lyase family protein [Chloroflexota bacterium]|nr:peptidyl-alpha-hydroxyglycine alpha-amidating lyase family protein [Chloroflexota bacterium]
MSSNQKVGYKLVEGWEKLPSGFKHLDVVGAAVDAADRVYIITRSDARVIVYERDGSYVTSWGEGIFTPRTHCIRFGADGSVFTVDDGDHTVRKFTPDGQLLLMLGTPGVASDTGYSKAAGISSIVRGGPPFNRPTGIAIAPNGELYVSDGYGNARVHRFSPEGDLIQSWGEPGTAPGQFNLPHSLWVMPDGRVMVADRENDRIQFFTADGAFLYEWTDVQRPTGVYVDKGGLIYVSELWWKVGQKSFRNGPITEDRPGRVSVFSPEGEVLARWGSSDRTAPGQFIAPHGLCVDSHGDLYVAEVTYTFAAKPGLVPIDSHCFQKFARVS